MADAAHESSSASGHTTPRSVLKVLTFLVADLAESTSVLESLGEGRGDTAHSAHLALLRNAIVAHRGRELHRRGDRFLVAFDIPTDAVACAVAVQRAAERHNKRGLDRLDVRIGIQFGEASESAAVSQNGDYLAAPANEARQLCEAAQGSQILVTDIVSFISRSEASHTFERTGLITMEGTTSPWPTFEVVLQGVPGERPPLPTELSARPTGRCAFVGRDRDLQHLQVVWAAAADGQRRLAIISGEPGIGKSRLAAQFAQEAHRDGAVVLSGRSFEESVVPYQPFVEALRQYVADCNPIDLDAQMGADRDALATLVPEVATRFAQGSLPSEIRDRHRLFEGIASFLAMISITSPVLLVLDDLQWADHATLLLLKHLVLDPRPASILIIGTHRSAEVTPTHQLGTLLSDIERDFPIDRLALSGLDVSEVSTMFDEMIGRAPPAGTAENLHADTGGNPFFVQEVVAQIDESGIAADPDLFVEGGLAWDELGVPTRVKDFVARRVSRLSPPAVEAVAVASIVGTEFGLDLLAHVMSIDVDDLVDRLDEAVAKGLLAEVPDRTGTYTFAHTLYQQAIEQGHSANRRAALHARVATALESLRPDDPETLSELARHYALTAGRYAEKVVHYGRLAGDRALAGLAYEDAVAEYARALDAMALVDHVDDLIRADLLVRLGEAQTRAGLAFKESFEAAAGHCTSRESASILARAALGYGGGGTFGGVTDAFLRVDDTLVGLLERALSLHPDPTDPVRVKLLARLAQALYWSGDTERMESLSQEALSAARRIGDASTLACALDSQHVALWRPEHAGELRGIAEAMLRIGEGLGDADIRLKAYAWLITDSLETDPIEVADRYIRAHGRLSSELRQPYHLWYSEVTRGMRAHLDGRFGDMTHLMQTAFALGQIPHGANAEPTMLLYTYMLNFEIGSVHDVLDGLVSYSQRSPLTAWKAALAVAHATLGNDDEATEVLSTVHAEGFDSIPRDCVWLATLAELSIAVSAVGTDEQAHDLYSLLLPFADRNCVIAGGFMCLGPVSRYLGLLATATGDLDRAQEHLEHALDRALSLGSPPLTARVQSELAAVLLTRADAADTGRAAAMLEDTLRTASDLGMATVVRDAEALLADMSSDRGVGIDR